MRRFIRRFLLIAPPVALLLVLGRFVAWGAMAETAIEAGPEPITQILDEPDLGRHVRALVRLPYPADEVWQVLQGHDYRGICPYLHAPNFEPDPDRTTRLTGQVQGWVGTFPLDARLAQEQQLHEYRSTWEASSPEVPVNRGRFVVTPTGSRETVLEIAVAAEVRSVPTFLVRLMLRDRLAHVLANIRQQLDAGPEW